MSRYSYLKQTEIECPYFSHQFHAQVWLIVNTGEQPDLLQKLQQGKLRQLNCPHCWEVTELNTYVLVYRLNATPNSLFSPGLQPSQKKEREVARLPLKNFIGDIGEE